MVDEPGLDAVVDVNKDAVPMVEHCRVYGILKELQQDRHIDDCTEYGVASGKVFGFFHELLIYCDYRTYFVAVVFRTLLSFTCGKRIYPGFHAFLVLNLCGCPIPTFISIGGERVAP